MKKMVPDYLSEDFARETKDFQLELTREAWREWEIYCCQERHGAHSWLLRAEHPDEGGYVDLRCAYCPADGQELGGLDYVDMIQGEVGGIYIQSGQHTGNDEFEGPVTVDVLVEKFFNPHEMIYPEYDVWIQVQDPASAAQLAFEASP